MKLNFIKMNPTENMTIFILDNLPRDKYIDVAKKVMDYNSICAEQVGFVEQTRKNDSNACLRLQMMGGEFCGNATRALAAALVYRNHCGIESDGHLSKLQLEVSGADDVIKCEVSTFDDKVYQSKIEMPLHRYIKSYTILFDDVSYKGQLVEFEGIVHYIVKGVVTSKREPFFHAFKKSIESSHLDAMGIMFLDEDRNYITPLVYVKETESLIWERGCGSGSTAVGIAISYLNKSSIDIDIEQPGGVLRVSTTWSNNQVTSVQLDGQVSIVAEGILQV